MNNTGYIHTEPKLGDYVHGDGKLGTVPLVPGGQWDSFLPETHQQDENGFEPFDCVTEATINATETLELQEYGTNTKWARRALAKASGTDKYHGNDPQTVSETLRTQGCVTEADYSFKAPDFNTFYQALTRSLTILAIGRFAEFAYGHSWVNANPDDMMAALEYSPLTAAGDAWTLDPVSGYYKHNPGSSANHDFMVYGYEKNNYWKVRDSYAPFEKKLAWDYQFTGVKRHTLHRQIANTPVAQSFYQKFLQLLYTLLGLQGPTFGAARSPKWSEVQKAFVKANPVCAVCDKKGTLLNPLNVHHQRPFHLHPELELDPNNLITLCRRDHFLLGHLLNWSSYDADIVVNARIIHDRIKNRP